MSNRAENTASLSHAKWLKAVIFISLSGVLYGFLGYFGTHLQKQGLSLPTMLFWRFFIAGIWMVLYVVGRHEKNFIWLTNIRSYVLPFVMGAICYGGSSALFFVASPYIGTGLSMVIFFSYPVFVMLFSVVIEKLHVNSILLGSILAILVGLFLLKGEAAHPINVIGIGLAVSSALLYAIYVFKSKNIINKLAPPIIAAIVCLGCATLFFILALSSHSFAIPTSLKAWLNILAIAIFVTAIPIQLLLEGLKHISSVKASILSVFEPVVTVIVGVCALGEVVSAWQLVGVVIILAGTVISQFSRDG